MEKPVRVLIIDDSIKLIKTIKEYFNINKLIQITGEGYNGEEGLNLILSNQLNYDVIIMDIIISKKDGIAILETMKAQKINKKVMIITSFNQADIFKKLSEYKISYFLLKPFDFADFERKIIELAQDHIPNWPPSPQKEILIINKLLHSLGVPSSIKGYRYLRESICLICENPRLFDSVTKHLYPQIAAKNNTTSSNVERAIRHAIEVSWSRGNYDLMEEIFGHSISMEKGKPTNSEFLATIVDKIKLES